MNFLNGIWILSELRGFTDLSAHQGLALLILTVAFCSLGIWGILIAIIAGALVKGLIILYVERRRSNYHLIRKASLNVYNYLENVIGDHIPIVGRFSNEQETAFKGMLIKLDDKAKKLFSKKEADDFLKIPIDHQTKWGYESVAYYYNLFHQRLVWLDKKIPQPVSN